MRNTWTNIPKVRRKLKLEEIQVKIGFNVDRWSVRSIYKLFIIKKKYLWIKP